jgi:hypothetical protein
LIEFLECFLPPFVKGLAVLKLSRKLDSHAIVRETQFAVSDRVCTVRDSAPTVEFRDALLLSHFRFRLLGATSFLILASGKKTLESGLKATQLPLA